jgi:hypothetical protein
MRQESDLTPLNVSLARLQREFVEAAARSGCTTTSEYVPRLSHDAQRHAEQEILADLDSRSPIDLTPQHGERKRREWIERFTPQQA